MTLKKDLKKRILNKAREEFYKNGFSKVKTEYLAKELGISKRTLYEYYKSKEKLFEDVVFTGLKEIKKNIDTIISRIAKDEDADFMIELKKLWDCNTGAFSTHSEEFIVDIKRNNPNIWDKISKFKEEQIKTNFRKISAIGIKKGYVKPNVNEELLFLIHYNTMKSIMQPEVISQLPLTITQVMENILEVLFTGALSDKGREEFYRSKEQCCK